MDYFNQSTERLVFRKLTETDIPSWEAFFVENDRLHFLGLDLTQSVEFLAKDWISAQFERYTVYGLGHLAITLKEDGQFIGLGGIIPREFNGRKEFEIAYSLKPPFWKKGYGTELAQQLRKFGEKNLDIDRFISNIHKDNIDSIRVAEKNGMEVLFEMEYMGMPMKVYGTKKA